MSARQNMLCFQLEIRSIKQFWRQFLRNTTAYFNRRCDFKPGNIFIFFAQQEFWTVAERRKKKKEGRKKNKSHFLAAKTGMKYP